MKKKFRHIQNPAHADPGHPGYVEDDRRSLADHFYEDDILGMLPTPKRDVTPNSLPSPELKRLRELEVSRRTPKTKRKTRKNRKR